MDITKKINRMKNLIYSLIVLGLLVIFTSCEDIERLEYDNSKVEIPSLSGPTEITLTQENETEKIRIEWTAANYNLTNPVTYDLKVALADSGFDKGIVLASTSDLFFETTIVAFNTLLVKQLNLDTLNYDLKFQLTSYVSKAVPKEANLLSYTVKPYASKDFGDPLYLIGDATPTGWNNPGATQMVYLGKGQYELYVYLKAEGGFKFIQEQGKWAPQYGLNTGDFASGSLKFRETDDDDDTPTIPAPAAAGYYKIEIDFKAKTYKTSAMDNNGAGLFLLGDGTTAGWSNSEALPMNRISEINEDGTFKIASPSRFQITTDLKATGVFKFLNVRGTWAPQWGFDSEGKLKARPTDDDTDPPGITSPGEGTYIIEADIEALTYKVAAK